MSSRLIRCVALFLITFLFGALTFGAQAVSLSATGAISPELNFLLKRTQALSQSNLSTSDAIQISGGVVQTASGFNDPNPMMSVLIRTDSVIALRQRGVQISSVMGDVVSASATLNQLREMKRWPEVIYVENSNLLELTAQPVGVAPELNKSVMDFGAHRWHNRGIKGEDVVIGIVDTGVDWTHLDFRVDRDGDGIEEGSRIQAIWDQTNPGDRPDGFSYGAAFTRAQIEEALALDDASLVPQVDANPSSPSHGTQALSIAGGDGSSSDMRLIGVAPKADLVMVKSPLTVNAVLDGVKYIFDVAGEKPAVASLSLGGHAGAHDGSSNFERALDALAQGPGRVIVVSAGNDGDENIHVNGMLAATGKATFTFDIPASVDRSRYSFDFWYEPLGNDPIEVRVIGPSGDPLGPVVDGEVADTTIADGGVFVDNVSQGPNPNNGINEVLITVYDQILGARNPLRPGRWTIELKAPRIGVDYHGWSLDLPFSSSNGNNESTVRVPATAKNVIAVGAYVTRNEWPSLNGRLERFLEDNPAGQIAAFSSLGPTRDGRIKPDLTAPGSMIAGAMSKDSFLLVDVSRILPDEQHMVNRGTSFAAPHVSGAVALLLQTDPMLKAQDVLQLLTDHASRDTQTGFFNSNIWGNGRLNLDFDKQQTVPSTDPLMALDTDENGFLGDREILTAIQLWVSGGVVPNVVDLEINDIVILWLIEIWIRELPLGEV